MLHVKNCLFYGAPLYTWSDFGSKVMGDLARRCEFFEQPESTVSYTPWGNLTGRFLNSAVFSLHLRRDIGHILYDDFSTSDKNFSAIKKSPKPCRFRRHL